MKKSQEDGGGLFLCEPAEEYKAERLDASKTDKQNNWALKSHRFESPSSSIECKQLIVRVLGVRK